MLFLVLQLSDLKIRLMEELKMYLQGLEGLY